MVPFERAFAAPAGVRGSTVVAGGLSELVNPLLGDLHPLGGAELLPNQLEQVGRLFENCCHTGPRDVQCSST
jgi:hypothetical protein